MMTALLLFHMLVTVALIGAITHQALSVLWPVTASGPRSFFGSFRAVRAGAYTNAVIVLYVTAVVAGALLYPDYRLDVRTFLEAMRLKAANGAFEIKEHYAALGLGMLPVYWLYWRKALTDRAGTRKAITLMLALTVWWNFIVGHLLNNIRGFGL
jgi:hypothetical protein